MTLPAPMDAPPMAPGSLLSGVWGRALIEIKFVAFYPENPTSGIWSNKLALKFSDCIEKLDIKCDCGGAEKIRWRRDWSVGDFDSIEIRLGKSAKFDGAGL